MPSHPEIHEALASYAHSSSSTSTWDDFTQALGSAHFATAQQRVLRQMMEAMLFEGIFEYEARTADSGQVRFSIQARDLAGHPVCYVCEGEISASFGRICLSQAPMLRNGPGGERPVASAEEFLYEALAYVATDESLLCRFIEEIKQTLLKDTLSLHARTVSAGRRSLSALEGQLQDGHPYHPCYKSRIGFDVPDNYAFGPEFQPDVRLAWVALKRSCASMRHCRDVDFESLLESELTAGEHARWVAKLKGLGLDSSQYALLPVHPWQWREKISTELFPMLAARELVWLGEGEDAYRPLQSIRSLANASHPDKCQIKLPISIVNTSADRILSSHNVDNAPAVSDWLAAIARTDGLLTASGLIFLRELAGVTLAPRAMPPYMQSRQYGMLGAVWRESVETHLQAGEAAAPFSGLCQCEKDGTPFINPWVIQYGLLPWLEALLQATLPPLLHLLYAHGIGMEAHGQNITLIHRGGLPCRIALKDLPGGLRFIRAYLAQPQNCPELVPTPSFRKQVNAAAGMELTDPSALRDYFSDGVFFINFGQLGIFLQRQFDLDEMLFWQKIADCIYRYQTEHRQHADRFAAINLFAPTIQVEQLAKRRLFAETQARLQPVPNPLSRCQRDSFALVKTNQ